MASIYAHFDSKAKKGKHSMLGNLPDPRECGRVSVANGVTLLLQTVKLCVFYHLRLYNSTKIPYLHPLCRVWYLMSVEPKSRVSPSGIPRRLRGPRGIKLQAGIPSTRS